MYTVVLLLQFEKKGAICVKNWILHSDWLLSYLQGSVNSVFPAWALQGNYKNVIIKSRIFSTFNGTLNHMTAPLCISIIKHIIKKSKRERVYQPLIKTIMVTNFRENFGKKEKNKNNKYSLAHFSFAF